METAKYLIKLSKKPGISVILISAETGFITIKTDHKRADLLSIIPWIQVSDISKAIENQSSENLEQQVVHNMTGQFIQMLNLAHETVLQGQKDIRIPTHHR